MMPGEGKMDISIDRLPSPTWKWLGVNHADLSADIPEAVAPEITVPAGSPITVSRTDAEDLRSMRTGCGPDMARLVDAAGDRAYEITVPAGERPAEPVIIRADLAGGRSQAFRLVLRAEECSEMTAVMVLSSSADAGGQAAVQTLIDAAPGAKVRLVQVDLLGSEFRLISDVGGRLGDRASADLADAILGGREIYTGRSIDLAGDSSRLGADVGYMIGGDTVLDMNYEAVHRGKRTESRMDAEGSLRGRSKKTFRGTIDFRSGCSGSKGSEKEDILMFDDGVENKTVPWDKISNYFNRDGGPLAATSITVPPAMYDDFVKVCEPLADYNPDIPFKVNRREGEPQPRPTRAGGSDHAYFQMRGIPAISFRESDIFGYDFNYRDIWHTEDDLFDKLIPAYMEHSAVVQAVTAYGLANLDHLLSREGLFKEE